MRYFYLFIAVINIQCSSSQDNNDTLVFARGSDSIGLDPALETDGESFKVCDNIYETLVSYEDESTSVIPKLAHSWDVSEDLLTWTFHLRTDVLFHDGTKFNSDSMVFSLERQMDPNHPYKPSNGAFNYWRDMGMNEVIKELIAKNDSVIVFKLKRADAPFLSNLAMNFCAAVSPTAIKKHRDDYFKNPVGTGPFHMTEWLRDERIVLERNKSYWGPQPSLQRIIFRPIHDSSLRFLELQKGTVHGIDNVDPEFFNRIKENPKLKLITQPGMNVGYLAMNMDRPPFNNLQVRRAINHAINRRALVDNFYNGMATVAKNPIPPTLWAYNNDIKGYPYDPEQARILLAAAGFKEGFETELWAMPVPRPYMPQPEKIAQAIQADLLNVGIRAQIVRWEWGTYLEKVSRGEHPMALLGWTGDNGDPDNFLYVLLDKSSARIPAQNIAFYRNEDLHKILIKARTTFHRDERTKLYYDAQEIIFRDAPWVPLVHATQTAAFQKRVMGFRLHPTGTKWFHRVKMNMN
ncbi:MAG: ABC transporter substrate-binding protein [Candidatus Latescibacterota bacterium]|nr:ABC transporter substrate-binding protein [Candidatus Latescibacterota bacterium]